MKILLLGSGGREHALAKKLSESYHCDALFIAPGNTGTQQYGSNVSLSLNDFNSIRNFCVEQTIGLLVVGPEEPLVNGIYDFMQEINQEGIKYWDGIVVGPSKNAAQLEGSKAFSKLFMQRHNIPTAAYASFTATNFEAGKAYIQQHSLPIVLKADGLAAGKGVVICEDHATALSVYENMIQHAQFGEASKKVVIEEFLTGIELSVFVLTNGTDYQIIGHAKDYKRIGEGDTGLNTGGMGCISPVPFANDAFMQEVETTIIQPTIKGLQDEQLEYNGFIFFGLMKVGNKPYVIEYNCRMGDPETEVVIPRLQTDLVALFAAMHNGTLADVNINVDERAAATIVAVSGGYPEAYEKNKPIHGLDTLPKRADVMVFHAGTCLDNNQIVTNGGRVLAVTALAHQLQEAVTLSKQTLSAISFDGMYYRNDIGYEFL
ncbi:MAG: phosphoribosylamine--glycine ligase [Sphingobacteriales bacterium]|uniref:phosphoribosylamine--glycine ligase n=1 Tax=Hydrotalea flava TaxID=714549 RepID=UPI00082DD4B0|nr:phosphoribosylamine--glycine ligase [Hydrotalea flava]RTL47274.1 MAG: phosphoribosylamine--glycine ligase [Sphingobacteriales bacterium]